MKGQTVRIIVHEPKDLFDENIFARILSERSGKLTVEVASEIKGTRSSGKLLMLIPTEDKGTIKRLMQYYAVLVDGYLMSDNAPSEHIFTGVVTFD